MLDVDDHVLTYIHITKYVGEISMADIATMCYKHACLWEALVFKIANYTLIL